MRCTSWQAFLGAIKQREGMPPCSYYLFSLKETGDVSFILFFMERSIFSRKGIATTHNCVTIEELLSKATHPSLFGDQEVFVLVGDEISTKKMPKNVSCVWITTSKNCQVLEDLYSNEVIWLDLSFEKPWERQARLSQEILHLLEESKKSFSSRVVKLFTERFEHLPFIFWVNELQKLLLYSMDLSVITESDAKLILSEKFYPEGGEFQDIEKILQGTISEFPLHILEGNGLFVFINKARALLEKTLWVLGWLFQGLSEKEMCQISSSISPYFIKKISKNRSKWDLKKLQGVAVSVQSLEVRAKKRVAKPSILFSYFLGEIHCIYRNIEERKI